MVLKATHADTGDEVRLFQAEQSERSNRGEVTVTPVPGDSTSEVILSDFKSDERGTITGVASANRLSNLADFSNDRLTALYEYANRLMLLVPISPGSGWQLSDDPRSETVNAIFKKVRWQKQRGEPYTLQYSAEFDVGEGIGDAEIPLTPSVSPTKDVSLDGQNLGPLENWSQSKEVESNVFEKVVEGENTIVTQSGPVRRIEVSGEPTTNRDDIDDKIKSLKGTDTTVTYQSTTGETIEVIVDEYTSRRESSIEGRGNFELSLVEGQT